MPTNKRPLRVTQALVRGSKVSRAGSQQQASLRLSRELSRHRLTKAGFQPVAAPGAPSLDPMKQVREALNRTLSGSPDRAFSVRLIRNLAKV